MQQLTYTVDGLIAASGGGLCKATVYNLFNSGKLEKIKVGRRTLITAKSVHALLGVNDAPDGDRTDGGRTLPPAPPDIPATAKSPVDSP